MTNNEIDAGEQHPSRTECYKIRRRPYPMVIFVGGALLLIGTLLFFVLGPRPWFVISTPGFFIGVFLMVLSGGVSEYPQACPCQKRDPFDIDSDEEKDLDYCN